MFPQRLECSLQRIFPLLNAHQLHAGAGQRDVGGQNIAVFCVDHRVCGGEILNHDIIGRMGSRAFFHAKAGGRVGLRVKIAQKDALSRLLQCSGQIDRRGRFPHAALLIDKCQNLRHTHFTPLRPHFAFYYNVLLLKMQEVM